MKSFKQYTESCWKGYKAVGVKKKGDRIVPNCVPVKEDKLDDLAKKHNYHFELSRSAPTEHLKKQHNKKAYVYLQKMADIKGMKIPSLKEDGMAAGAVAGPTNVTGVASSTDPVSATAVNMKKKNKPVLMSMVRRKKPQ